VSVIKKSELEKVWRKADELAEKHGMTRDEFIQWSDGEFARKNITEYQCALIMAYQTCEAIKRLRSYGKENLADKVESREWWVKTWKKDFNKVDEAIKHLTEVCEYLRKLYGENYKYHYEYLLNYDDILYKIVIDKAKSDRSKFRRSD